jgi:hypothetical protein
MLSKFEEALDDLCDWLRDQGFDNIAQCLEEDTRPKGSAAHRYSPQACQNFLRDFLAKKPKRYQEILAEGKKRKFTRSQIDYAAEKIGVMRHLVKGHGERTIERNVRGKLVTKKIAAMPTHSVWSLFNENE